MAQADELAIRSGDEHVRLTNAAVGVDLERKRFKLPGRDRQMTYGAVLESATACACAKRRRAFATSVGQAEAVGVHQLHVALVVDRVEKHGSAFSTGEGRKAAAGHARVID